MKLKDVPKFPVYLVFHDPYDNGAMDVFGFNASKSDIEKLAEVKQRNLESYGGEGIWKVYEKLPRKKVWRFVAPPTIPCA